jgi:hypothetical protein
MAAIPVTKQGAAAVLLVVGVLCLGRAVETSLDRNPNRIGKRETITAGILLGGTATPGGIALSPECSPPAKKSWFSPDPSGLF